MMKFVVFVFSFFLISFAFAVNSKEGYSPDLDSPYGICSHLSHREYPEAEESLKLMRSAGITFVRTGFPWLRIEKKRGEFDYTRWDNLMKFAEENDIIFSANFPSGVPVYARPFPHNPDILADVLEKMASRYKGKIKYWEMVNEPNHLSFWGGLKPNPQEYAELIKKIYPAIKRGDPNTTAVFGGLAGVPLSYLEEVFKAGATNCFDIMNVHPYEWRGIPEDSLFKKINGLRALMKKYGVGDKKIWFSEIGHTSASINPCTPKYYAKALQMLGVDVSKTTITFLGDEKYGAYMNAFKGNVYQAFPTAKKIQHIDYDSFKKLTPEKYPVLYIGGFEGIPYFAKIELIRYVKEGGIVVADNGIPFFFHLKLNESGEVSRSLVGKRGLNVFRIGIKTFTEKGMEFIKPKLSQKRGYQNTIVKLFSGKGFEDVEPIGYFNGRIYLNDSLLKPNDKFIPFLWADFGEQKLPIGAIYKYGGNMKGAFIALLASGGITFSEELQATMLPREYILSRSIGIEKIFKYCFRSSEIDFTRESHFGIVRKNLEPKPAFYAYKTMTEMLGKAIPTYKREGNIHIATWEKSDGTPVCAVWKSMYKENVKFEYKGEIKEAKTYLGEKAKYSANDGILGFVADAGITYFVGIKDVKLVK